MKRLFRLGFVLLSTCPLLVPALVWTWGDEGHEIVASIVYARLTPQVRTEVDAMFETNSDKLTAPNEGQ